MLYIVQSRGAFRNLKGHSHLYDRADLDTSFLTLEKGLPQPKIKVHLEIHYITFFAAFCLTFNRVLKSLFFSVPLLIL